MNAPSRGHQCVQIIGRSGQGQLARKCRSPGSLGDRQELRSVEGVERDALGPLPNFLTLGLRLACAGKSADDLVFAKGRDYHRLPQSQDGWFAAAVKRAMRDDPNFPKISPHDLRRAAPSLAISAGASVKAVQRTLGHASASITLDTYADLFESTAVPSGPVPTVIVCGHHAGTNARPAGTRVDGSDDVLSCPRSVSPHLV